MTRGVLGIGPISSRVVCDGAGAVLADVYARRECVVGDLVAEVLGQGVQAGTEGGEVVWITTYCARERTASG